jgi:Protein of unknown function (DUF4238)
MAKHHYVPRFLLKQWHSSKFGLLTRMGWEHGKFTCEAKSASVCARQRNLYRLHGIERPEALEDLFLGTIDNAASKLLARFLTFDERQEFSEQDRADWSRFLVALMRRHPVYIQYLRRRGREEYDNAVEDFRAEHGKQSEFESWLADEGAVQKANIGLTRVFTDFVTSDAINNAIVNAHWKIRYLGHPTLELLIGDRPVAIGGALAGGFALALPISPAAAFFAYDRPDLGDLLDHELTSRMVKMLNGSTVAAAHRHVFGSSPSQREFVKKNLNDPDKALAATDGFASGIAIPQID